ARAGERKPVARHGLDEPDRACGARSKPDRPDRCAHAAGRCRTGLCRDPAARPGLHRGRRVLRLLHARHRSVDCGIALPAARPGTVDGGGRGQRLDGSRRADRTARSGAVSGASAPRELRGGSGADALARRIRVGRREMEGRMTILQIDPAAPQWVHSAATAVLYAHIGGGALGMISGTVALFAPKGETLHRAAGNVFFVSMLTMAGVGAVVSPFIHERGSSIAGILTFYLVLSSWVTVRRKEGTIGRL